VVGADEVFRGWIADIENIRWDVHQLFALRRTFRDVEQACSETPVAYRRSAAIYGTGC
jgi:hypothetical protein